MKMMQGGGEKKMMQMMKNMPKYIRNAQKQQKMHNSRR